MLPAPMGQDPGGSSPRDSALGYLSPRRSAFPSSHTSCGHSACRNRTQKVGSLVVVVGWGLPSQAPHRVLLSLSSLFLPSPSDATSLVQAAAGHPRARSTLELAIQLGRPDVPLRLDERIFHEVCVQVLEQRADVLRSEEPRGRAEWAAAQADKRTLGVTF